jgi:hypothetical protein
MSEQKKELNINTNKPISAYQQLSGILTALKTEEITLNDAMNKIQLKNLQPTKPYCKVTSSGALALYGIKKEPIVMYADQWNKLLKVTKSPYIENYIKYNSDKLKFKIRKQDSPSSYSKTPRVQSTESLINENAYENV